jgi:SAM-dependent methyltransferase
VVALRTRAEPRAADANAGLGGSRGSVKLCAAVADEAYGALAGVYEWLVPDSLLAPEGAVAAFTGPVGDLEPGARVLDCAAGTGQLAVGLALRGHDVTASDASSEMIARTRELAARHGATVRAVTCAWDELPNQGWDGAFDAVFCVGNSITHAAGRAPRRAALGAMRGVLRRGGMLAVTSRNWERLRAGRPGLQVADRLVERRGRTGLVVHAWTLPDGWGEPHALDVAVAVIGEGGAVTTVSERLSFWPFTHDELQEDLRWAGLEPLASTYEPDAERYLVTARA